MDVQIVVLHSVTCIFAQQIVIHKGFCGLAGELHHHSCGRVGVHVGVLTRHVVVLDVDYLQEDVGGLCLTRYAACVAVLDIGFRHILSRTLHQFVLHHVLDSLHGHLRLSLHGYSVGYLAYQSLVLTLFGGEHSLTDSSSYLLFVESNDASISLLNGLYHCRYYCGNRFTSVRRLAVSSRAVCWHPSVIALAYWCQRVVIPMAMCLYLSGCVLEFFWQYAEKKLRGHFLLWNDLAKLCNRLHIRNDSAD